MKKFLNAEVYSPLLGQKISQICIGRYIYTIVFDGGDHINAEYKISFLDDNADQFENYIQLAPREIGFSKLIDQVVLSVSVSDDRKSLSLVFPGNQRLTLHTEIGSVESGEIGVRGETLIF